MEKFKIQPGNFPFDKKYQEELANLLLRGNIEERVPKGFLMFGMWGRSLIKSGRKIFRVTVWGADPHKPRVSVELSKLSDWIAAG